VLKWFKKYNIPYQLVRMKELTRADLLHLLTLTEDGFDDLLIRRSETVKKLLEQVKEPTVNEMIDFCLAHPEIIRQPISFDQKRLVVGFHEENIRIFAPRIEAPKYPALFFNVRGA
jgi:regulatory protein spx